MYEMSYNAIWPRAAWALVVVSTGHSLQPLSGNQVRRFKYREGRIGPGHNTGLGERRPVNERRFKWLWNLLTQVHPSQPGILAVNT